MSSAYYYFSVYQAMDSAFRAFESDWLLKLGIVSNYSPKWRWMVVDIYQAAQRRGRYPPLSPTLRWIIVLVYTLPAK